HGFAPHSALLDYGCGWGLFGERARECGYSNVVGYDPYSAVAEFRDPARLGRAPFDYILLQDVLEHVEDPRALFAELDAFLKPGGCVLVGTPNADDINLRPYEKHWLELHPPYHLHIYTRAALSELGSEIGWREVDFFDRVYCDTKTTGVNMRMLIHYQKFGDGTLDSLLDAVPRRTMLRSPKFMFFAF